MTFASDGQLSAARRLDGVNNGRYEVERVDNGGDDAEDQELARYKAINNAAFLSYNKRKPEAPRT